MSILVRKFRNLPLFILIVLLISVFGGLFFVFQFKKFEKEISLAQITVPLYSKESKPILLIFAGDIMLDRGVEESVNKYGKDDWKFPFLKIADTLREADILFGNLEGPISDKGVRVGSIYSFRAEPEVIEGLKFAGFDILSVSNNHILDYGRLAMEDTFLRLKKAEIDYVGGGFNEEEAYSPIIKEINPIRKSKISNGASGTKIAFLAYTNLGTSYWSAKGNRPGIAWLTKESLEKGVKETKEKADLVIVSMHFGEEYQSQPNQEQKYFVKLAIDSGANLVIGHHPHIIQPVEKYNEGYIAYSLGNFVFDQVFSEKTMKGLLLKVLVKDGKIKELIPIEIEINQYFQPEIRD